MTATVDPDAEVAASVHRIAVMLRAGVAPDRAWRHLADVGDVGASRVVSDVEGGIALDDAIARGGGAWGSIAVVWRVAQTVGAPLAESLGAIVAALRDGTRSRDDVAVALAEPAATARLMAWLPLVAVGLGAALGFDPISTLTQPLGATCVVAGLVLMIVARRWSARLVAAAQPDESIPGLQAEITAIALSGGVSIERALSIVEASGGGEPDDETAGILALSEQAGVPVVELLRAEAAAARDRTRTQGRLAAARVGARLLLPLGVCTLPSFLLLGVGPMLLSVLGGATVVF